MTGDGGGGRRVGPAAWFASACVVVGGLWFGRALSLPFLGDDLHEVHRASLGPSAGEWFSAGDGVVFLRPVFRASLWLDHALHGTDPTGYHLTNVALHVVASLLVACFADELVRSLPLAGPLRGRGAAALPFLAGGLFLVLPSHGEPVYWISGRADLLATCWSLASLVGYLRSRRTGSPLAFAASLAAFALALLSKESAVALPAVVWLFSFAEAPTPAERGSSALWAAARRTAPHLAVLAGYLGTRWVLLGTPVGGYDVTAQADPGPLRLAAQYVVTVGRSILPSAPRTVWFLVLGGVLVTAPVVARAVRTGRPGPAAARRAIALPLALAGAVLVTTLPVAGIGAAAHGPAGERVVYLPSAFAATLVAVGLAWCARRPAVLAVACAAIVAAAVPVGVREANRWTDAGRAASAVLDPLVARPPDSVVHLVNAPDSVRGAVAFRNAAAGVDPLLRGEDAGSVRVVTGVALDDPEQPFDVQLERAPGRADLLVRPVDGAPILRSDYADDLGWGVTELGHRAYRVEVPPSVPQSSVRVFDGGELRTPADTHD